MYRKIDSTWFQDYAVMVLWPADGGDVEVIKIKTSSFYMDYNKNIVHTVKKVYWFIWGKHYVFDLKDYLDLKSFLDYLNGQEDIVYLRSWEDDRKRFDKSLKELHALIEGLKTKVKK